MTPLMASISVWFTWVLDVKKCQMQIGFGIYYNRIVWSFCKVQRFIVIIEILTQVVRTL